GALPIFHLGIERDHARRREDEDEGERAQADAETELGLTLLTRLHDRIGVTDGLQPDVAQRTRSREPVDDQANEHPDARRAEAPVPPHGLAEEPRDELAEEGADVDPHVEDREPRIPPRPAL